MKMILKKQEPHGLQVERHKVLSVEKIIRN